MDEAVTDYLLLFAAGTIAGTLNVIAGGGSLLTLPVMIFLGLPATVANGTNRVAILAQNVGAVWRFQRHQLIDWRWLGLAAWPALAGAALGTWFAVEIGDEAFRKALAILMVALAAWTLWDPLGRRPFGTTLHAAHTSSGRLLLRAGFFLAGVYGGFVQAGVGFVILAVITLAGLDLVRGNALKVLLVLIYTPLSLALFVAAGKVEWGFGAALAAGSLAGGLLGVRLTVLKGHAWIKRVVTITIVLFAIRLWYGG
ncbi:MAG: sulfite exporter TauE/SafE family protein [Gemmatimonadota bacterium]